MVILFITKIKNQQDYGTVWNFIWIRYYSHRVYIGTIRLWLILLKVPMFSLYGYSHTGIFLFAVLTNANHYRMFAVSESFWLVTQHINGCCHKKFRFTHRFTQLLQKHPKTQQKKQLHFCNCLIFSGATRKWVSFLNGSISSH